MQVLALLKSQGGEPALEGQDAAMQELLLLSQESGKHPESQEKSEKIQAAQVCSLLLHLSQPASPT